MAEEIDNAVLFDDLMNEAERCFIKSKRYDFLNPIYGLIGSSVGCILVAMDFDAVAMIVLSTSIVVGIIGITLTVITHKLFMRGMDFMDKTLQIKLDPSATADEVYRRFMRSKEVLDLSIKKR